YSLPIQTNLPISAIEKMILALEGFELVKDPASDDQTIVGPGLVGVWVLSQSEHSKNIKEKSLGFRPDLLLFFRLEKFEKTNAGYVSVLKVTMELLNQGSGDAALLVDGEDIALARNNGRIVVYSQGGLWSFVQPTAVTLPYELNDHELITV
ncbi:MAG: hypothetical protein K2X81_18055, partial [Candidatus Obscuribacterales bacterium]|nr:hypothetical protein [Candidatus Obscuribacterales bacterium]